MQKGRMQLHAERMQMHAERMYEYICTGKTVRWGKVWNIVFRCVLACWFVVTAPKKEDSSLSH